MIFFHPELAVAQQEVEHFVLAVVEAKRVPCGMLAAVAGVEVLRAGAVEASEALGLVLDGVAVHYVHNHGNALRVGLVDEGLELFGRTEAAAGGEEVADVVAEGAVVGMLLYGHYLYGVVAVSHDAGQHVGAEFVVGAHALVLLGHAYVALVDEQRLGVGHEAVGVAPLEALVGLPHLGREDGRLFVLHHARGVGGDAFAHTAGPVHHHLVELSVADVTRSQVQLPHAAVAEASGAVFQLFLPVGEVADEHDVGGVWRPFAEYPRAVGLAMQAEVAVGVGEVGQRAGFGGELFFLAQRFGVTSLDGVGVGLEPGVVAQNRQQLLCIFAVSLAGFGRCRGLFSGCGGFLCRARRCFGLCGHGERVCLLVENKDTINLLKSAIILRKSAAGPRGSVPSTRLCAVLWRLYARFPARRSARTTAWMQAAGRVA